MLCGKHILFPLWAYVKNLKYMYISLPGYIVDYTEYILGLYTGIVVLYMYMS